MPQEIKDTQMLLEDYVAQIVTGVQKGLIKGNQKGWRVAVGRIVARGVLKPITLPGNRKVVVVDIDEPGKIVDAFAAEIPIEIAEDLSDL